MATDNWQVLSQMLGSQRMYIVGRLIDSSQPLHGGNVEYAPDSHYTTDKEKAEKLAEDLNKQTSEQAKGGAEMEFYEKIELIDGGKVSLIATSAKRLALETHKGEYVTSVYLEREEIEQLQHLLNDYLQQKELPYGVEE